MDPARSHAHSDVRAALLAYVLDRVPDAGVACLAGSTVHADKGFLVNEMPEFVAHLHYRIVDVSSVKELVRRWYGDDVVPPKRVGTAHRYAARLTQRAGRHPGIDRRCAGLLLMPELAYYREQVFRAPRHGAGI